MARFEAHGFAFRVYANPSVAECLTDEATLILTTRAQCDCGTAIGSACSVDPRPSPERHVARLKAKGWGDAKIARWLQSKSGGGASPEAADSGEVSAWVSLIRDVLRDGSVPWIGLFAHFYEGRVSDERVALKAAPPKSLGSLVPADLLGLPRDVLLLVSRPAGAGRRGPSE